jgi:hypothetical protein
MRWASTAVAVNVAVSRKDGGGDAALSARRAADRHLVGATGKVVFAERGVR